MSGRRVEYTTGAGLLQVGGGRLLFVNTADHSTVPSLTEAARAEHPLQALEAVVTSTKLKVPPFVFVETSEDLRGVVRGPIQLEVQDTETSLFDGAEADPWMHLHGSAAAVVSSDNDISGDFWLESGVVHASAFRWTLSESPLHLVPESEPRSSAPLATGTTSDSLTEPEPDTLELAPEATTQADDVAATKETASSGTPSNRTVEALICFGCSGLNPPMTVRCRGCNSLLADENSELQTVAQPALGVIHLSGGRVELFDADLLIGRYPRRYGLMPHQREVVHGVGDHSISRLHIELKIDGWNASVINYKGGWGTTIETRLGGGSNLPVGSPRRLNDGDLIRFGGAWLRYEEGTRIQA